MPHPTGPTDPQKKKLISSMKRKNEAFYSDVARHLEKPRRSKSDVNVGKIEKCAHEGESVVVPGKVLGSGEISKRVHVYAWLYSKSAKEKIVSAGGTCLPLEKLLETKAKGRILI